MREIGREQKRAREKRERERSFKEMTQLIVGAGRSEISRLEIQVRVDVAIWSLNSTGQLTENSCRVSML